METANSRNLQNTSTNVLEVISECFVSDRTTIKILRAFAYSLLIVGSLAGNSLIIAVVRKDKKTKPTVGYFILNMAAANLLITVVYMPRMASMSFKGYEWLVEGITGLVLCKLVTVSHHAAILVSIQTLVIISVDRFLAIVYPLKRNISKREAKILVGLSWVVSVCVRIPRFLSLTTRYKMSSKKTYCVTETGPSSALINEEAKDLYYKALFYIFYAVPVLLIIVLNSLIVVTLIQRKVPGNHVLSEERRRQLLNRRVFRMLFVVTCLFVVCWMMYFLLQIKVWRFVCSLQFIRLLLAHTSSALTPCVYFTFSSNYRCIAVALFRRISPDRNDSIKDTETSVRQSYEMLNVCQLSNTGTSTPVLTGWKRT